VHKARRQRWRPNIFLWRFPPPGLFGKSPQHRATAREVRPAHRHTAVALVRRISSDVCQSCASGCLHLDSERNIACCHVHSRKHWVHVRVRRRANDVVHVREKQVAAVDRGNGRLHARLRPLAHKRVPHRADCTRRQIQQA
jgi:hypothetical protein